MNVLSFAGAMLAFSGAAVAIAASPAPPPDHEGLLKCLEQHHPSRYCRIVNGYAVSPLDSSGN